MNLFFQPLISRDVFHLDADESRHCVKVLRKKKGDRIDVTDGQGQFYVVMIEDPSPSCCTFSIQETRLEEARPFSIHIAIAPTKNADRVEWFVEKAVELGVEEISFMECQNSERTHFKTDRINRIAVSAMKQSLRARLPVINPLQTFTSILQRTNHSQRFIAVVDASNPSHLKEAADRNGNYLVLIGPEGDFSHEEVNHAVAQGFVRVSLGPSRLRTETAGIAACHILNLVHQ